MGNIQFSGGDRETPHYGYSCLSKLPSTRPLRFSSGACASPSNYGSRLRFPASAGEGSVPSTAMCCQPVGQHMETFKNRHEALTKARYYRDRDFELAIHAYSAALDFAPPVFRRSPPPHADDEQMLYIQLLDPTGFRGDSKEEGEDLVHSIARQASEGHQHGGHVATQEAVCVDRRPMERSCDSLGMGLSDMYTTSENDSKGLHTGNFREGQDSSTSTAFESTGSGVSRMQSGEFSESKEGGTGNSMADATSSSPRSDACGRIEQQEAAGESQGSSSTSSPAATLRQESEALAAHHALTAEICDEVAQLHLAAGHKEEALRYYDRAVRLAPQAVEFLYRRGVVLQLIGEGDAAIDSFRKALELEPAYKAALFNLGTCLMRSDTGRKEALQLFHQLTQLDPTNDQVLSLMAHCYEIEGRYEEALTYRQRAVQLDPENFRANRELNQLEQQLLAMGTRRMASETAPTQSELVSLNSQRHVLGKVA